MTRRRLRFHIFSRNVAHAAAPGGCAQPSPFEAPLRLETPPGWRQRTRRAFRVSPAPVERLARLSCD